MKKTLAEEALDEAKQVREVALANAKLALEAAFEPRIKSMISKSLQAEAAMDDDEEELEEMEGFKDPTNAATAELDLEQADDTEDDTDIDLEEIIAELESELEEGEHTDDDDDDHDADMTKVDDEDMVEEKDAPSDETHTKKKKVDKEELEEGDDEEIDLEELLGLKETEDLEDEELEEGEEIDLEKLLKISEEEDTEEELEEGDDEEIDLEELLGLAEEEDETEDDLVTENARLASELKEHREALEILRTKLNEVNLLNAKLLYTTKLFKKYSLDNSQKMKVVESFDRTKTVREAKLIYSTLSESLGSLTNKKATSRRSANSLTEGLASSVVQSTKPKTNIISESNDITNRFKKLINYNVK